MINSEGCPIRVEKDVERALASAIKISYGELHDIAVVSVGAGDDGEDVGEGEEREEGELRQLR